MPAFDQGLMLAGWVKKLTGPTVITSGSTNPVIETINGATTKSSNNMELACNFIADGEFDILLFAG
jgi:hypothetical protein